MKRITITLDQEIVDWARAQAADKNISLSRFVGELLREKMKADNFYEWASPAGGI